MKKNRFRLFLSLSFAIGLVLTAVANSTAPRATDNGKIKIACVGNSITYGMTIRDREHYSYPSQLAVMLGEDYEVGNFGKNGATLLYKGHRPYVEQEEFAQAVDFNPDILVMHLGVNDTDPRNYPDYADNFIQDYLSLIDSFRQNNPDLRVILANLSPLNAKHYRYKSGTRAWRDSIRGLIPRIAMAADAELIDFGDALKDYQQLIPDGIHPDRKGARILAETVYSAITGDYGGLKMPKIYGDGMVVQRYKPLVVNGTANTGDTVTVALGNHKAGAVVDNRGRWSVTLPAMKEAVGLAMTVTSQKDTIQYNDIAVGEVWIASGQSNMEFRMNLSSTFDEDIEQADDPLLRLYDMKPVAVTDKKMWSETVMNRVDSLGYFLPTKWRKSDRGSAKVFSAVAWNFGKMLRDSLKVPVGIICNAVGGSPAEAWIDIETLEHTLPEILIDWRTNDYMQTWVKQRIQDNIGSKNDTVSHRHPYEPSYLFASGIKQLGKYPVAGAIWYQGESNAHNIEVHEILFPALIKSWRSYWDNDDMPFIFVQLSSMDRKSWSWFRDSQRRLAERLPYTWMAVCSDLGDSLDVHPRDKRPVGQRLARQALNHVYSMQQIVPEGPRIKDARYLSPDRVILTFDYSDGLTTSDGMEPITFEIAGPDGIFCTPDSVYIKDNMIILKDMHTTEPQYVRYGWQPFTRANLVNGEGLPVSTFKIAIQSPAKDEIEEGVECGVSGAYVGCVSHNLIQAGGCNFPSNPMAPDSKKKFYQGIYRLSSSENDTWKPELIGTLPYPMAYGAAVPTAEGLFIAGGTTPQQGLGECFMLTLDCNGKAVLTPQPQLPYSMDNFSATILGNKIYIAGGNVNGSPSNRMLVLDLDNPAKGWTELPSFPGNPRVQPVVAGVKDMKGNDLIYIWSGFAGKSDGREATLNTDGIRYNVKKKKWDRTVGPVDAEGNDISVGGGACAVLPDGRVVVTGGVNKDIFLEALRNQAPDYLSHPVEWYRFNQYISVFDPATEQWTIVDKTPETARAGAGMAATENGEIIVSGGEIKPRIRTTDIYLKKID